MIVKWLNKKKNLLNKSAWYNDSFDQAYLLVRRFSQVIGETLLFIVPWQ